MPGHLGGKRGRLILPEERQMAMTLITQACINGARKSKACEVTGISVRTLQRWNKKNELEDQRANAITSPSNKLTDEEKEHILDLCNQEEFRSLAPKQIVPILADRGTYIASESSFYRVLREAQQVNHRGRSAAPEKTPAKPEACTANGPNQVWSWDITFLNSTISGCYFYLYLFMDIYSRKIVGWEIHENESSERAAEVLRKTRFSEPIPSGHDVILHSDNGSPMKGATMLATMQKLGVVPSFSRPSVSNDNPYSEALFKTLKYTPVYPTKPFDSLDDARAWVKTFTHWYNTKHRHSALKYVTPQQRHTGQDVALLEQRKDVYEAAKRSHPERWSGNTRDWTHTDIVKLNPGNEISSGAQDKTLEKQQAA